MIQVTASRKPPSSPKERRARRREVTDIKRLGIDSRPRSISADEDEQEEASLLKLVKKTVATLSAAESENVRGALKQMSSCGWTAGEEDTHTTRRRTAPTPILSTTPASAGGCTSGTLAPPTTQDSGKTLT